MSDPDIYIKNGDRAPVCRFYTKALRHGASFTYTASDRCGKWLGFSYIFVLLSCGFTPTGEHIYFFVNGDRAPVYVALLGAKPLGTTASRR